jgi:GNAT superfamily N-acetyltransferase
MRDHDGSAFCALALVGDAVVGMAWLFVFDRVPGVATYRRRVGDIQSVFVLPAHRRAHIGRAMLQHLNDTADALGLPYVVVQSNDSAMDFYASLGFEPAPHILQRTRPIG